MTIYTRPELEKLEINRLQPYALTSANSKGRVNSESPDEYRTNFQLDRNRILHTKAFRRLKGKTQVQSPTQPGDHYRDRLTHTMEVAQVSRAIASNLGLNEDAAEAIALAHDLGHPPFGHLGEYALDECLQTYGSNFEHNEQSYRIVEPLNLSYEILEGLQKHQTPFDQVNQVFVGASLEAQAVNLADEIAYLNHDLDDGLRLGVITQESLDELTLWQKLPRKSVSTLMKLMLKDLFINTEANLQQNQIKTLDDVYNLKAESLVCFSATMRQDVNQLRQFLFNNYYMTDAIQTSAKKGQAIIKDLFGYYLEEGSRSTETIRDYIAGMTDSYAQAQWELLITAK